MIISARRVKNPRKRWYCSACGGKLAAHIRLYGASESGDKPYELRVCDTAACAGTSVIDGLNALVNGAYKKALKP